MDSIRNADETTGNGGDRATDHESSRERRLRLRVLLAEYRLHLLIALVIVALLGGAISYSAYATPDTETEEQLEHRWAATGVFEHSATVEESTAIYDAGTALENEPLYYTSVTPEVDGEFVSGYDADSGEDVQVELTVELDYRAVEPNDDLVYWSEQEHLASTSESAVEPGDSVGVPFTLNVSEATTRINEIESELGASPGETELTLEISREIDGVIDGEHRMASDEIQIPIRHADGTYELAAEETYDEPYESYETVTIPSDEESTVAFIGPLLLMFVPIGAVGLWIATERIPAPTVAEREWLAYRDDRAQFEEVITPVELPSSTDSECATVETLADLVTLGLDSGETVLFDRQSGQYVVHHDGVPYVFEPPELEMGDHDSTDVRLDDDASRRDLEAALLEETISPATDTVVETDVESTGGERGATTRTSEFSFGSTDSLDESVPAFESTAVEMESPRRKETDGKETESGASTEDEQPDQDLNESKSE